MCLYCNKYICVCEHVISIILYLRSKLLVKEPLITPITEKRKGKKPYFKKL